MDSYLYILISNALYTDRGVFGRSRASINGCDYPRAILFVSVYNFNICIALTSLLHMLGFVHMQFIHIGTGALPVLLLLTASLLFFMLAVVSHLRFSVLDKVGE